MQKEIEVKRSDIDPRILRAFPGYNGRKFRIEAAETVTLYDLNWGGGTRSQYSAVNLITGEIASAAKFNQVAPWENQAEGQTITIPQNVAIVKHSIFCGRDYGLKVYFRPENMPAAISAPGLALSPVQSAILKIYREHTSEGRKVEFAQNHLPRFLVSTVTKELESLGAVKVNSAGAVSATPAGRNADCANAGSFWESWRADWQFTDDYSRKSYGRTAYRVTGETAELLAEYANKYREAAKNTLQEQTKGE